VLNFVVLILALAAPAPAAAVDVAAVARKVDAHYNQTKTLTALFSESYTGNGMERSESGTLWLKKPGKMRWEYRSPRGKLFLSDGKDAWFYVPGDQQARRTPVRKLEDLRSPISLLLGKTKLEKELQGLSVASEASPARSGDIVLRGVPRNMQDRVSEVLLEITPENEIARLMIREVDGSQTEFRFSDQKQNVPVAEDRFHFSPPPGVGVVDADLVP
jgi:outer membrane lipoprotein carrier protein